MSLFEAAEVSYKHYLSALCFGCLPVSVGLCIFLSADPFTIVGVLLVSFAVGAVVVVGIAAPIYAGLLYARCANYGTALLSAALISASAYPLGGIFVAGLFALYGVPISLLAHFLARRARRKPPSYNPGFLRG